MYEESLGQGIANNNYKWPLVRATPFQEAIKILKDLQREKWSLSTKAFYYGTHDWKNGGSHVLGDKNLVG